MDVKHKTSVCRLSASKEKRKYIRIGNVLWSNIAKRHIQTKINKKFKLFKIEFYTTLRLCNLKLHIIVYISLLIKTLEKNAKVVIASFCTKKL